MKFYIKNQRESFAQLNLDTGDKILISITGNEIAVFKLGFLSIPYQKIWKSNLDLFIRKNGGSVFMQPHHKVIEQIQNKLASDDCKSLNDIGRILG